MPYTIGCRVVEPSGKVADGIYAFGKYGLAYVATNIDKLKEEKGCIYFIKTREDAELYVRYASRMYRSEFRKRAKKLKIPVNEFRFYLVKISDKHFANCSFPPVPDKLRNVKPSPKFLGNHNNITLCYVE